MGYRRDTEHSARDEEDEGKGREGIKRFKGRKTPRCRDQAPTCEG